MCLLIDCFFSFLVVQRKLVSLSLQKTVATMMKASFPSHL